MTEIKIIENLTLHSRYHGKKILADIRYQADGRLKPVVLYIHGFKAFKDWGINNVMADYFARYGFVYVKISLSHNGTNLQNPQDFVDLDAFALNNFSIELDDTEVLIDHLFSLKSHLLVKEMELNKFFLIGHSRGGGIAILKAHEDSRIKALATWAAVSNWKWSWDEETLKKWKEEGVQWIYNSRTKQNMPLNYQIVEDLLENQKRLNIENATNGLNIPFLLIHGTDDETVPFQAVKDLKTWNPSAQFLPVEGATHTFGGKHPFSDQELPLPAQQVAKATIKFFKSL